MQYVTAHVSHDKTCISTPEICAHDGVRVGRWFGTSATKKNSQVIPRVYVHFTCFGVL